MGATGLLIRANHALQPLANASHFEPTGSHPVALWMETSRKIGINSLSVLSHHRTYRSVYGGSLIIFSDQLIIIRQEDITSLTKPIGGKRSTKDKTISSVPVAFPSIRPLPSFGFRYS